MRIQLDFDVTPYEAVAITGLNSIWEAISLYNDFDREIRSYADILLFVRGLVFVLDGINGAAHGESAAHWQRLVREDEELMRILRLRLTEILAAL